MGATRPRIPRPAVLALAATALAFAGACANPPPAALEEARAAYDEASSDPLVTSKAPVALYEAQKSLERAERAWEEGDETETRHRSSLARTRVEIARVSAQGEQARARSRELAEERERVLLEARTAEVGAARAIAARESERARGLAASLEELRAKETERGTVLTLSDVLFDFDRATLRPGAEATLDRVARFLREQPERELLIEGHTDSVGPESYNRGLSRRRAEAVESYLARRGIDPGRIVSRGYGEELPVVSNETGIGRQQNRRVEIVVLDPGESAVQAARRRAAELPAVGAGPPSEEP